MKVTGLILCTLFFAQLVYAQKLTFEIPTKINAQVGEELSVKLNVAGIEKYSIIVEGNPASSFLRNNKFIWTPKANESKDYRVKFF